MFKCGYIGIIGKTNVGKSTLVNFLVGEKVAIVSPKTQTTRDNILGILTKENIQFVFVDTPGIHKTRNYLDKTMMKNVRTAISSVDVVFYIMDLTKKIDEEEIESLKRFDDVPLIVGLSKADAVDKKTIFDYITKLSTHSFIKDIIPFSTYKKENTDTILNVLTQFLPESEENNFEFDESLYTDKSVKFLAEEIIREKTLQLLNEELPHGISVQITKFVETDTLANIDVDLTCERETHKPIIIGKNGQKLKEIGTLARIDIEKMLDKKVMLKIWVKVLKDWRLSKKLIPN